MGMVASIRAPLEASVKRRLILKVTGKMAKRMAPRSTRNGKSCRLTWRRFLAPMKRYRNNINPP
jgi:hypothetical protein